MKNIKYSAVLACVAFLGGCGGGSDSNDTNQPATNNPGGPPETVLKCDRGVLLNSILPTASTSIFDEPLYQFTSFFNDAQNGETAIYADELKRDGQMLYRRYHSVYNTSDAELNENEAENTTDLILNTHGLFGSEYYKIQNNGWPAAYLVATQGMTATRATFNDQCSLQADTVDFDFEKVDLSGKKIADIFPAQILSEHNISRTEYTYLEFDSVNQLKLHTKNMLTALLQSDATFPKGAYAYVPKTVVYKDTQFYFGTDSYGLVNTLDEWIEHYKRINEYKFKQDTVAGYKVAYNVDEKGNELYYPGADPALEKDGKIHDGQWNGKGNVISPTYGGSAYESFSEKGRYAYMNASSYEFIRKQIQTYYK